MELTKCTLVMLISSLSAKLVIKKSGVLDPIINTNISVQTDIVWIIQHYITTVKKINREGELLIRLYSQDSIYLGWTMGRSKDLSEHLRRRMIDSHKLVRSLGVISKQLQIPGLSLQAILCRYKLFRYISSLPRTGRRPKLSPSNERKLVRMFKNNPGAVYPDCLHVWRLSDLRTLYQQSSMAAVGSWAGAV